ncbi:MAG TPA: peptide chain release factor N(5)-glutamine methyltransferase [Clostridiales bacterium]|nr:peptide chain release factor N(5)-glutamine methyltransferase [Clostridiales bacterium]
MTYRELFVWLKTALADRDNGEREAAWLIQSFAGRALIDLDLEEQAENLDRYEEAVKRLEAWEPFQYVLGCQWFYGAAFAVDAAVLIPRFETELLVEIAVKWGEGRALKALDLCTGSGCIAISLAKNLNGSFLGLDISTDALAVAEKNNLLNGTDVRFMCSDLFSCLAKEETFDLITANPPYLTEKEMAEIPPELNYEPAIALDGGLEGLFVIEGILKEVAARLNEKGLFLMEIGEGQGVSVLNLAEKYQLRGGSIVQDLNGKDRIFLYHKN